MLLMHWQQDERGTCALHIHTGFALCCRHQGCAAAAGEGAGSFEAITLPAILARAVSCGQVRLTRSLMSLLCEEDSHHITKFRDASGMGLLHLAVRSGSLSVLEILLEECSVNDWQVSGC